MHAVDVVIFAPIPKPSFHLSLSRPNLADKKRSYCIVFGAGDGDDIEREWRLMGKSGYELLPAIVRLLLFFSSTYTIHCIFTTVCRHQPFFNILFCLLFYFIIYFILFYLFIYLFYFKVFIIYLFLSYLFIFAKKRTAFDDKQAKRKESWKQMNK